MAILEKLLTGLWSTLLASLLFIRSVLQRIWRELLTFFKMWFPCCRFPQCLFFLDMLQQAEFREVCRCFLALACSSQYIYIRISKIYCDILMKLECVHALKGLVPPPRVTPSRAPWRAHIACVSCFIFSRLQLLKAISFIPYLRAAGLCFVFLVSIWPHLARCTSTVATTRLRLSL